MNIWHKTQKEDKQNKNHNNDLRDEEHGFHIKKAKTGVLMWSQR